MDTGTIRTIGIVGACVLGIFLFVKSIEMKENRKAEEYLTANLMLIVFSRLWVVSHMMYLFTII